MNPFTYKSPRWLNKAKQAVFNRLPPDVNDFLCDNVAFSIITTNDTLAQAIPTGERPYIIEVTDLMKDAPLDAKIGIIAHEAAHVWLGKLGKWGSPDNDERQANKLAVKWGFGPEIAAMKEFDSGKSKKAHFAP
jgi:hypothetical protein